MEQKYQIEIDEFRERFGAYKNKRIVIYGIGRYTATLVEGVKDFQFVGLMDKNPENIGKEMFGLPIISKEQAEQIADLVVINTSETYWDVIYKRIEDIQIPVFYKNGERAAKKTFEDIKNPFEHLLLEELQQKAAEHEVVSFDFFDTLFMRTVCSPKDVFILLEDEIKDKWTCEKSYVEIRNKAIEKLDKNYTYDELYEKIKEESGLSDDVIQQIKRREWEIEKKLLVPRNVILELFEDCIKQEKEVYLISDMYLPKKFYIEKFQEYGIEIEEKYILISNELKKSKEDGTIWKYFAEEVVKERKLLHIGDNEKADIRQAEVYGIDTYLTPNPWDLFMHSPLREISPYICTIKESLAVGWALKELFGNPYKK